MKKLALAAIACAGLTQATGCIFVSDDDTGGQFRYSWTVSPGCLDTDYISFVSTGPTQSFDDVYDCTLGQADSPTMELGSWTISGSLVNDNGTFSDMSDDFTVDGPINMSGQLSVDGELNTDLATFAFVAGPPPISDVNFGVDYGVAGGMNCTATPSGSGVAQQEIRLYDVGGSTCLDIQIFTNDNMFPGPFGACETGVICYENNTTQTFADLPDGDYEVEVIGYKGATGGNTVACYYSGAVPFSAPTADIGNILAAFDPLPADDAECNATKPLPH
jgi:hypothetical protein